MNVIILFTGIAIIAEALFLITDVLLIKKNLIWANTRNKILLFLDIITGAGIVYLFLRSGITPTIVLSELLIAAGIGHILRLIEYFNKREIKFCLYKTQFVFTIIKLLGIFVSFLLI